MTNEPAWLLEARKHEGLKEIPGMMTSPTIARWLQQLSAWWRDDETPWCGTFVAAVMRSTGHQLPTHWYRAKGWLDWGEELIKPVPGAVVIFERQGGGHVGFVVAYDQAPLRLLVLGGNQGNAVSIAAFDVGRVLGYRWPAGDTTVLKGVVMPVHKGFVPVSRNER